MKMASRWWQGGLAASAALAVGFWLGNVRPAAASGYGGDDVLQFQLAGMSERSSLLVYEPSKRTVYVYQGALTGSSQIGCSYMFHLGRPGEPIHRENCPVTTMQ